MGKEERLRYHGPTGMARYIIPDAPRLALLSDLHGRPYQEAVFSLQRNKPDIICITGDIIYGIWPADDISPLVSQPYVLPFLERCAGIAPTYLSLGNHEQALDQKDLETIVNTGVTVLDNNWAQRNGVVIGGLTSAYVTDYRRANRKTVPVDILNSNTYSLNANRKRIGWKSMRLSPATIFFFLIIRNTIR